MLMGPIFSAIFSAMYTLLLVKLARLSWNYNTLNR